METTTDLFSLLPKEIALLIYDYLTTQDLSRGCSVNKFWNQALSSDQLWRKFVTRKKKTNENNIQNNKEEVKSLKWVYVNRKMNWMHGQVERFTVPGHQGGSYYITHILSDSNILVTGSRGDIMEEYDMAERRLNKHYEVPTGPASTYRMDDTTLVIDRNGLKRWPKHDRATRMGNESEFTFALSYNPDYPQSYKFVRERLLFKGEAPTVKLYDMNTGQMVWSVDEGELSGARIPWNGLDMDYNRGVIASEKQIILFDLNEGKKVLQFGELQTPLSRICKLEDDMLCWSTGKEIVMTDMRKGNQPVWTVGLQNEISHYSLRKIVFDEYKCLLGCSKDITVIDVQNPRILYSHKWDDVSSSLVDFSCNDEYLAVVVGSTNLIYDYTKKFVEKYHLNEMFAEEEKAETDDF